MAPKEGTNVDPIYGRRHTACTILKGTVHNVQTIFTCCSIGHLWAFVSLFEIITLDILSASNTPWTLIRKEFFFFNRILILLNLILRSIFTEEGNAQSY